MFYFMKVHVVAFTCCILVAIQGIAQPCLQVQCPTNKTVQCGSTWTFDTPIVSTCCANGIVTSDGTLTNALILSTGVVTNGVCPRVDITQTWLIIDGCSNSATCSQTVTVLGCCPTNCLVVQCPTNKSVACGTTWTFDSPVVSTCCTNLIQDSSGLLTNILVTPTGVQTNGACPQLMITEMWLIMDGCSNSAICSQTVTVMGCCPSNCLVVQCPTNKTVECGTAWTFDTPVATSCCTNLFDAPGGLTNVLITPVTTMTNGVCPKTITRTWKIIDGCLDTNFCSQAVTVVDTTPPVITCRTNIVVVSLNSNCDLVIPAISATATDNCTPLCSLVYSQSPPAGTIIAGNFACVTVTVTDLCGNSNSCVVCVQGLPRTPPVVTCPATMTVTNCVAPCVPVSAYSPCCPQRPMISQSPPCGTMLGPGVTSITVTVTDCHGNVATKVVQLIMTSSTQSFLANLPNTGVGPGGVLLADAVVDTHYALPPTNVPGPGLMPADYFGTAVAVSDVCHATVNPCNLFVPCNKYAPWGLPPDPAYPPAASVSKWISPDYTNLFCCPFGYYIYTLNFTLPAGFNPATASISGRWSADTAAIMTLNGNPVPAITPLFGGFWVPFTIPPSAGFVAGVNTLQFTVQNISDAPGLRVEFTSATACDFCAPAIVLAASPPQSLPVGSTATLSVAAAGTPLFTYQWSHNDVEIPRAISSTLQIPSVGYADAGDYAVIIGNPCGGVTRHILLTVTPPWPWQWGWWSVASITNPLGATFGPDLSMVGSSFSTNYGINTGSTEDFGLPAPGGQIANVMAVNPQSGGSIEIPQITPPGVTSDSSYTVVMDYYEPDTSLGIPSTLFQSIACCVSNLTSGGQDGVGLTLDASNYLHIAGSAGGMPFDGASAQPMAVDTWTRLALVVDNPTNGGNVTMTVVANGGTIIIIHPCTCCTVPFTASTINWPVSAPTVFSAPTNAPGPNGTFYVAGIQFHDVALTDDMLAGLGSPEDGPVPGNQMSIGPAPLLSATMADGSVNLAWTGSPYALQETTDLNSGAWSNSEVAFIETVGSTGEIVTTAVAQPTADAPRKFYRLVFRP
jgi:hypothetical protein